MTKSLTIGVTGAGGLIGWHTWAHLHALNASATFKGQPEPLEIKTAHSADFESDVKLAEFAAACDVILHFAGVNRGTEEQVEFGNIRIAERLIAALEQASIGPNLVFANSTHSFQDSPYGRGKRNAAKLLRGWAEAARASFSDMILPHIFGEFGRPNHNSVTSTFCKQLVDGQTPTANPHGRVDLLHVGQVARVAIDNGLQGHDGAAKLEGTPLSIPELVEHLTLIDKSYRDNIFPDLSDRLTLDLFNTYRSFIPMEERAVRLKVNTDARGHLFEAAKGGGGGQAFVSLTHPGITRGNHYHLYKAERFLVLEGEATIRLRRLGSPDIQEYYVTGDRPTYIDIPTLHTHNITNIGPTPLLTLFWAHELFDPANPDTYMEQV